MRRGHTKKVGKRIRLWIRLDSEAKDKIEQAAVVSQQSLNDFVVTNLSRVSEEALGRQGVIRLSDRDRDLFLTALDADVRPNRALRKAAEQFTRCCR